MGKTTDQIQDLRAFAQEMGRTTAFSATEAADGLNILAMSGLSAKEQMAALPGVMDLAAAGTLDLSSSAAYVTGTVKGFRDEMGNAQKYADLMAKGATMANTSVSGLGEAMSQSAANAKTYNQGADSLTLSLLRLAEQNVEGEAASTALNRAMSDLYAPTASAQKALRELGISAYNEASGAARDFNEVVDDLNQRLSSMTDEQRNASLSTIFTTQGLNAFNKMVATSPEKLEQFKDGLKNSLGSAAQQAATQLDNLAGDITYFKSALEGAQIALSDRLTPSLRQFVQFGTNGLGELTAAFQEGGLSGAMSALGSILSDGLNLLLEQAPGFAEAGMRLLGALGQGILDNIPAMTEAAVTISLMLIQGLISSLPMLAEGGAQMIALLAEGIASALPELIPAVVSVIFEMVKVLTNPETLTSLLGAALSILLALAEGLLQAIPVLIEALPVIIENLITALIAAAPMLAEAGVQLFGALVMNLPDILMAILRAIPAVISGILNAFGQSELASGLSAIFQNAFSGIFSALEHMKAMFSGVIDFINNIFAGNWADAWQNIQDIFGNLFSAIVDLAKMPINGVIATINFVFEKINGMSIDIPDWVPGMGGQTLGFHLPAIPQLAEGGIVTGPTLLEAGEAGDEAIIPLPELWSNLQSLLSDTLGGCSDQLAALTEQLEGADRAGNPAPTDDPPSPIVIYYQPHLHFEGGTPSREDIVEAGRISQEEFNRMAAKWQRDFARLSLKE